MHVLKKVIESHEREIEHILDKAGEELSELEVRQIGYCLDNIKDCLEIKHLKHEIEELTY